MELLDESECTFKLFDGGKDIIRGGAMGIAQSVLLDFLVVQ